MFIFTKLTHYLYLFQLENYDSFRFFKVALGNFFNPGRLRKQKLDWTLKAKIVFTLSFLFIFIIPFFLAWFFYFTIPSNFLLVFIFSLFIFILSPWFFFLHLILTSFLLSPFDKIIKNIIITQARRHLAKFSNLTIIGITGSYSKTSAKNIIAHLLSSKLKVAVTPDSINTPLGVARFIRNQITDFTEILIVEMGAYHSGDIADLCHLTPPHISILTGINESHLERFKTINNTINTKFEIVSSARPESFIILNGDDDNVVNNYRRFISGRTPVFFTSIGSSLAKYQPTHVVFNPDIPAWRFHLINPRLEIGPLETSLLGRYSLGLISAAALVAEHLKFTPDEIKTGVAALQPIPHRLYPNKAGDNTLIIDDSYNGNPAGAKEAIEVLGRFPNRRKIYVTPGLVEVGDKTEAIHKDIGRRLAAVADQVVLIKTSSSVFIKSGLLAANFPSAQIHEFNSMSAAQAGLVEIMDINSVILFQNDWPDNYN